MVSRLQTYKTGTLNQSGIWEYCRRGANVLLSGGGFVALPVFIIGGMLGYWAIASEFNWWPALASLLLAPYLA